MASHPANREGARHSWLQRATAKALLVLVPLLIGLVVSLIGKDQATVRAVLSMPLVAFGLGLLILVGVVHMRLGLQAVIEDYIHETRAQRFLFGLNTLLAILVALCSLYSLLKLTLGL